MIGKQEQVIGRKEKPMNTGGMAALEKFRFQILVSLGEGLKGEALAQNLREQIAICQASLSAYPNNKQKSEIQQYIADLEERLAQFED